MRPFKINVVLARSIYENNIGASSRAMANMGAERLILIEPKCEITYAAQQAAATGQAALQSRTVYKDWADFHAHEVDGIRIAFTTKNGKSRPVLDYADVLNTVLKERLQSGDEAHINSDTEGDPETSVQEIYLIFGPEDWGLSNFDLELTHFNVCLPTFGENPSLNLAQAVLLALFQLRLSWGGVRTDLEGRATPRKLNANEQGTLFPEKSLLIWITEMGFDVQDRNMNAFQVFKRVLLHNMPNRKEMGIIETVLQQAIRKLREYNQLRKQLGLPFIESKHPVPDNSPEEFLDR